MTVCGVTFSPFSRHQGDHIPKCLENKVQTTSKQSCHGTALSVTRQTCTCKGLSTQKFWTSLRSNIILREFFPKFPCQSAMESQTWSSKRVLRELKNWRVQGNPSPTLCQPFANLSLTFSANPSPSPSFRGPQAPVQKRGLTASWECMPLLLPFKLRNGGTKCGRCAAHAL